MTDLIGPPKTRNFDGHERLVAGALTERQNLTDDKSLQFAQEAAQNQRVLATPKDGRLHEYGRKEPDLPANEMLQSERVEPQMEQHRYMLEEVSQTDIDGQSEVLKKQFADLTKVPDELIAQTKAFDEFLASRGLQESQVDDKSVDVESEQRREDQLNETPMSSER